MLSTPKAKGVLFLASSLCDGLEDNNIKQVTTLLENKDADPNVILPMHGITPFHLIIGNESEVFAEDVTKLFLRHGGNPNVKSNDGMTPVHVAAAWGRVKILELLLANGGDPLCLDDDGRSPFHYAFDGAYYDAITVLGKYCATNREIDGDDNDEEDEPKVQIKLEKILVNRGDVVAEYVSSEMDFTNETQHETRSNNISDEKLDRLSVSNLNCNQTSLNSTDTNSSSSDELSKLICDNITYRRGQSYKTRNKAISPILPVDETNFDIKERNVVEEKLLVNKIINRISDSYDKFGKKSDNFNAKQNTMKNGHSKNLCSLLPQSKNFKSNVNSKCTGSKKSTLLDTSIVSKSPNFKVPIKKNNEVAVESCQLLQEKTKLTPKTVQSSNDASPQTKSASSTPKRILNPSKCEIGKLSADKKVVQSKTFIKIPSVGETYITDHHCISLSPDVETTSKITKRKLYKNIVKNLDSNMNDEDIENISANDECKQVKHSCKSPDNCLKFTKFFSNVDIKTILGINKEKIAGQKIKNYKNKKDQGKNCKTFDLNIPIKLENTLAFIESPGSSHPTSASYRYQSVKNESELKICNELDEIYKNKGQSPQASISYLANDSITSLNTSQNSPSIGEEENITSGTGNTSDTSTVDSHNRLISNHDENNSKSTENSNTEVYQTPLRSMTSCQSNFESFISVDEEYAYVDADKDVAFMERRLRVLPKMDEMNRAMNESTWVNRNGELSRITNQTSPRTSGEFDRLFACGEFAISNASLRHGLIALGDHPGPVTDTTYYVYLKRLYKLKRENSKSLNQCQSQSQNEFVLSSPRISETLLSTDWMKNLQPYRDLEELAFREYERPNDNKKYRGGMAKVSFNYLLLDPRITKDLPRNGRDLSLSERWKIFLQAIFYVGKGKSTRPFAHLYESHEIWTGKKPNDESNKKIQRILSIWREGKGVVCHQIFVNSMQEEAFTREAAMIDVLGTNHLCNCNHGNYYGLATTMSSEEKKSLGKYLLYKAMEILMHDGERQQFPRNIE